MIRSIVDWVQGWLVTLDIMFNSPELYRELKRPGIDMADFTEVGPPG